MPAGTPHAIYSHPETGVTFHEVVGDFGKRATVFPAQSISDDADGGADDACSAAATVLGSDGKVRLVSAAVCSSFRGARVLVTGCSRGLGLEFVHQLVAAGAAVVATCRSPDRAEELAHALAVLPTPTTAAALDISDPASIEAFVAGLVKGPAGPAGSAGLGGLASDDEGKDSGKGNGGGGGGGGKLDVLISNAGISNKNHPVDPILGVDRQDLINVFATNVVGTVQLVQQCLPLLRNGDKKVRMTKTMVVDGSWLV